MKKYNPQRKTWTPVTAMSLPTALYGHCTCSVNGTMYVLGGCNNSGFTDEVLKYDTVYKRWTTIETKIPSARGWFTVCVIDSDIYVIGGQNDHGEYLSDMCTYNVESNSWNTKMLPMPSGGRSSHAACVLKGKIYVAGGNTPTTADKHTMIQYDPSNCTWSGMVSMSHGRNDFGMFVVGDDIYVVGGYTTMEKLKYNGTTWTDLSLSLIDNYVEFQICVL